MSFDAVCVNFVPTPYIRANTGNYKAFLRHQHIIYWDSPPYNGLSRSLHLGPISLHFFGRRAPSCPPPLSSPRAERALVRKNNRDAEGTPSGLLNWGLPNPGLNICYANTVLQFLGNLIRPAVAGASLLVGGFTPFADLDHKH